MDMVLVSKLKKTLFWGSTNIYFLFLFCFSFKTIDTQILFWSFFFEKAQKNY